MPAEGRTDLESLHFEASPLPALGSRELRRLVAGLRRQRELDTSGLDIERTVAVTAQKAGLFTPVFTAQRRMPEYLVLCDRRSADDHYYQLIESLLDPLARNGVPLERYDFSAHAGVCRRGDNPARQFTLAELAVLHHSAVLFVFAETDAFFDPLTGDLSPWVERLRAWYRRALFTFQPRYLWGEHERRLAETGAIVLQATADGLRAYADGKGDGSGRRKERPPYARRYPAVLAGNSIRWLDREAPAASTIEMLVTQLHSYLGPSGFDWLAACAVYPQVSWPLTLDLATSVRSAHSTPHEFTASLLPAMARLPWLRHGYIPDWLRHTLLRQLTAETEARIRAHLDTLLNRLGRRHRAPGLAEEHALDITAADMAATAPAGSPMKDAVFIGFVSGTNTPDLAVLAPRPLVRLFRTLRRIDTPEEQKIAAPARSYGQRFASIVKLFLVGYPRLARGSASLVAALIVGVLGLLLTTQSTAKPKALDGFHSLAFGRAGLVAAGISGDAIELWNPDAGAPPAAGRPIVGRQNSGVLYGFDDSFVPVRVGVLSVVAALAGVDFSALALSPSAEELAYGTSDGRFGTMRIDGTDSFSDNDPERPIAAVAIASTVLAIASRQGEGTEITFWKTSGKNSWYKSTPQKVDSPVWALALDREGELAALALWRGGIVRFMGVADAMQGLPQGPLPPPVKNDVTTPDALAISPDRRWLAVGEGEQLSLREISTGRALAQVNTRGPIRAIAISDSGDQVAVLSDVSIAVWPVIAQPPSATAQQSAPVTAAPAGIRTAAITPTAVLAPTAPGTPGAMSVPAVGATPRAERSPSVQRTRSVRPTPTRGKARPMPNAADYQQAPPQGAVIPPLNDADRAPTIEPGFPTRR